MWKGRCADGHASDELNHCTLQLGVPPLPCCPFSICNVHSSTLDWKHQMCMLPLCHRCWRYAFIWAPEHSKHGFRNYSHLSNKRDVTLTDFGNFHPVQNKNPPCPFTDFITKLSIFLQNLRKSFWATNLYSSIKIDGKSTGEKSSWFFAPLHLHYREMRVDDRVSVWLSWVTTLVG